MLTLPQKKASDLRRSLAVTANAGAGKTTVLVRRFLDIVTKTSAAIDEVVAITYTEKAAAELRKKIADEIGLRLREAVSPPERMKFEHLRDRLAAARICTIHAFCAQLLRDHPVEADIDAAFTVLEEVDRRILHDDAIRETFEDLMARGPGDSARGGFLECVRMLGRTVVQKYIGIFLRRRELVERLLQTRYAGDLPAEEVVASWTSESAVAAVAELEAKPGWQRIVREIAAGRSRSAPEGLPEQLSRWESQGPVGERAEAFRRIADMLLTRTGDIRAKYSSLPGRDEFVDAAGSVRPLIELASPVGGDRADLVLLRMTKILLGVYVKANEIYGRKKSEQGALDFEDLQLKVRELLSHAEIRGRISRKYKFIMVDEFQDTNRLQYEIVVALLGDLKEGNLFIVGDPKQSIYGFRGAEVGVFLDATNEIASRGETGLPFTDGGEEIPSLPEERRGNVVLPESFRLLPRLVAFVNAVFDRLMAPSGSPFETAHEPIVKGRVSPGEGTVELLLPHTGSATDSVLEECRRMAARILELRDGHFPVFGYRRETGGLPSGETSLPFRFGDAAVLLRNRRHVRNVERAFQEAAIPYLLTGGIGFYQTQEVLDFYNYFRFLLNPEDDVALAGILRSPFFAVSDAAIYECVAGRRPAPLWENLGKFAAESPENSPVQRAVRTLNDNLALVNRLSIPDLVERVFLRTGWKGSVVGLAAGRQSLANIRKLLRVVREFEQQGYRTLFDFVERLKLFVHEHDAEGQAALHAASDSVRILTIHSAKGLEFPFVFLPFAGEEFTYDRPPHIDPGYGISFKVRNPDDLTEDLEPPLHSVLSRRSHARTEAEEKRLLYVACTRARDGLVISGDPASMGGRPSYLRWILESLDLSPDALRDGAQRVRTPLSAFLDVRTPERAGVGAGAGSPAGEEFPLPAAVLVGAIPAERHGDIFSATHVRTFLECPSKYFLKYHLGLPETRTRPHYADEDEDQNDKLFGEQEGIITHAVLQELDMRTPGEDEVRDLALAEASAHVFDSPAERGRLLNSVCENVLRFCASPFGRSVAGGSDARTEFTLNMAFGGEYVTGTLDRLYRDPDGVIHIVDYKTDGGDPALLPEKALYYRPQLAVYALLASRFFAAGFVRTSLAFLRHGDAVVHFDFNQKELAEFERTLAESIARMKKGDFRRIGENCSFCTYPHADSCLAT